MSTVNSWKAYFEGYTAHQGVASVVFGTVDQLLEGLPGKRSADYPLLFVPYHERQLEENAADFKHETLSFIIGLYSPYNPKKGHSERHNIVSTLEGTMNELVGKLIEDLEEGAVPQREYIDFRGRGPGVSEPLGPQHLIGWAYEFDVIVHSPISHNPASWQ